MFVLSPFSFMDRRLEQGRSSGSEIRHAFTGDGEKMKMVASGSKWVEGGGTEEVVCSGSGGMSVMANGEMMAGTNNSRQKMG